MQIIQLNKEDNLALGHAAFHDYMTAVVCGACSDGYEAGMCREGGLQVLAGVINACIHYGLSREDEVVNAASRVTRCRRTTVQTVLEQLSGDDPDRHLWSFQNGHFSHLKNRTVGHAEPCVLLVA